MKRFKSNHGQKLVYASYDRLLSAWTVPYEQHTISTSYGITHVVTAGSSDLPPLLLLHGTGDNVAMMWIYNVEQLSRNFHIIAVDNIGGSGKSEPNDKYAREFNQATWLDKVLEAMNVDAVYIAGVSYGAYLAYHYAIVRPDRVNKIVCLAGSIAGSQFEVMSKMMRAFLPEALFPSERNVRSLLRKLCGTHADAFENNPELMQHWFYLLKYFNNRSMMKHAITIHCLPTFRLFAASPCSSLASGICLVIIRRRLPDWRRTGCATASLTGRVTPLIMRCRNSFMKRL